MTEQLRLNYAKKDYASMLEAAKTLIRTEFPEWNDFLDSDIGFAVLKVAIAVADLNNFYLDRQAAEAYLDTASERANVIAQAKALGYTPRSISAARVICQFQLAGAYNENIIIPRYTAITIEGKAFVTEEEGTILAGTTSLQIQCVQGSFYQIQSSATGEPFFKVNAPLNLTEVSVFVNDTEWVETPSFLLAPANRQAYRLYEDRDRKVIMFGSVLYDTPESQDAILVEGIQTDGLNGNTRYANSPVTITAPIYNTLGQNINNLLSATTLGAAVGGSDPEGIDSIKVLAPGVYSTQNRAVTANDYRYLALTVPGVAEASSWGGEIINRYGEAYVCIISNYADTGLESLIELVRAKIEPIKTLSIQLKVIAAEEVFVDIVFTGNVRKQQSEYGLQSVVVNRMQDFMASVKIGDMLQFSDLMNHMQAVSQIDYYMMEHVVWMRGTVNANELVTTRLKNGDYNDIEVWTADKTTRVWKSGDAGAMSLTDQRVTVSPIGVASGTYWVRLKTQDVNVLVQPYHKLRLGQVNVSLSKSQAV